MVNDFTPESTVTTDCIEMHLYRTPERNSDDVTAYFQFDGDTEPEHSGTAWEPQLSAYLNSLEWKEIVCPVDEEFKIFSKQLELVYVRDDKKYLWRSIRHRASWNGRRSMKYTC